MLLKTIAVLSLSLSSIAFGQSNSLQQRLLDSTRRVSDIVHRDINRLDSERIRAATAKLQEAEQILLGSTRPDPYPGNPGHPQPPPPPPSYPGNPGSGAQHISGRVGNQSFTVSARTTNEAFRGCLTGTASVSRADVVEVSINYGQTHRNTTGGWWNSNGAACAQIVQLLINAGMPSESYGLSFAGGIGTSSFHFQGRDIGEVGSQCENFVRSKGISRVDNIISTNFRVTRTLTTGGWWTTPFEMCQQILSVR